MGSTAWTTAKEIAEALPRNTQYSFCITDIEDDAVFNIYAPRDAWHAIRILLGIARAPEFRYDDTTGVSPSFEEHLIDGLSLSLITPEIAPDDESTSETT
jgi:hypothetical protein